MVDLKISQFTDGGAVQTTDEIATNRGGVNTKVFVGSAASRDVGTGDDDIPTNADIPTTVANSLFGTSDTENTIATGAQTFVTQAGKSFEVGRYLLIVDAANPDDNKMSGTVTSYDSGTGDLVMDITTTVGSGTIDDWIIYVSGPTGQNGADGTDGTDGDNGWSPVLAVVTDGTRRVFEVVDWVGGEGTAPATGLYVGATGLEADIADAVDVRGPQGPAGDGGAAADVDYDNTASGLPASNVQEAIDELAAGAGGGGRYLGEVFAIDTSLTGHSVPDNSGDEKYIQLTANLTGAGQYNEGLLTSQSVSGSAPLVQATAVVDIADSPMNGQTIRLLNTEGRYPKPGTSPGSVANDQMQRITGSIGWLSGYGIVRSTAPESGALSKGASQSDSPGGGGSAGNDIAFDSADSSGARTGTSTDTKHMQLTYFQRVK